MSAVGIYTTMLATGLSDAVRMDEAPEAGGFDMSAGLFGQNVSKWLRQTAKEFDEVSVFGLPALKRLRLAEAALAKNGFTQVDDVWVAPVRPVVPTASVDMECKLAAATEALRLIREAGGNFSEWAVWAQKTAAWGVRPDYWPKQPERAPGS